MKAITVFKPYDARMTVVPDPIPKDNEVVIKVKETGVCATDIGIYTGKSSFVESGEITYPVRFGHEFSGVVTAVGKAVKNFKVGDRVYTDNGVACGICEYCLRGDYENCPNVKSVGTVNCWDGCYAEFMLMPEYHVYKLPDGVSYSEGALIEPLSIALDAFRNYTVKPTDTVVVIGTGATGMGAIWIAKYSGAKEVIMVGRTDSKLAVAKKLGATKIINSRERDAVKAVKDLTNGAGAELVIETSGSKPALLSAIDMLRRDGRLSIVSFYESNVDNVPIDKIALGRMSLVGAAGRFGNPQKVAEMMDKNPVKLTPVITHRVKFENAVKVFENIADYKDKIKIMIDFD